MLLVRTYLAASAIHGIGLFAAEPIAVGATIWIFSPGFDLDTPLSSLAEQPEVFQQSLRHYGYIDPRLGRFILCADDYRFINHSEVPNIAPDFAESIYGIDIALRDIKVGEELLVDYRLVEGESPK